MNSIELGAGAEFDAIRRIVNALGRNADGLGDDCGFVQVGPDWLAISTDTSVEGTHFKREWLSLPEIGFRATGAALSDLAAVGASAPRILAAITAPDSSAAEQLMTGVGHAAAATDAMIIGGDLTRSRDLSLTITVIGQTRQPVYRSGARAGNSIWVSGELGLARAALESWRRGDHPTTAARERFARPLPRLEAGQWLAAHGATAMLDISDGLVGDAGHIAAASACRMDIAVDLLPLHPEVIVAAAAAGISPQLFAATGGEDYELLVTLPARFNQAAEFVSATGLSLTRIGACVSAADGRHEAVITLGGKRVELRGFDQYQ
ncbi:MAG: thiamine-phosphate kinase [Gemmatimonadota bacterium]